MESIGGILYLVIDGVLMAGLIAVLCLGDRTPLLTSRPVRFTVLSVLVTAVLGLGVGYLAITAKVRKTKEQKDIFAPTVVPARAPQGTPAAEQPDNQPQASPAH